MKKRLLSLFLAVWMIVGMIPAQAFAADAEGNTLYVGDQVGQYATLEEAYSAAEDGDTITLCKDIKLSTTLNITKNVTIDLGEYDITSFGNIFEVAANGELLIKGSGTISGHYVVTVRGGKVTVESGNISANTYGMMVWSGNVTILGGTIHGKHTGIYYSSGNHGIYGGTVSGGTYGVNVAGGKCEITGGRFSHDPSQYVDKSAYSVTEQDGWFVVSSTGGTEPTPPASDYVAMVGEQGYETLQAAVNAAQSGDTIELLKDVELTAIVTVPAGKNITLDLGGQKIESSGYPVEGMFDTEAVLTVCGEVTIIDSGEGGKIFCNSDEVAFDSCGVYVLGGKLNIEGGTISGAADGNFIYGVMVASNGTANISGGKIEVTGNDAFAEGVGVVSPNSTANIFGGIIEATGIFGYGVDANHGTANIFGGTISGNSYGVLNRVTVNIEGTANISGGDGSVVNIEGTANIKGGTFSGTIQNEDNGAIAISGGKFDKDPSEFVDKSAYSVTEQDGWYVVSLKGGTEPTPPEGEEQTKDYELVITKVQKAAKDGAGNMTFDAAAAETVSEAEIGDVLVVTLGIKNNTGDSIYPVNFNLKMYYDSEFVTPYKLWDNNTEIADPFGLKSTYMWGAEAKNDEYISIAAATSSKKGFEVDGETTKGIFHLAFQVNSDAAEGTAQFWFDQNEPQSEFNQNDGSGDDVSIDVYGGDPVSVAISKPAYAAEVGGKGYMTLDAALAAVNEENNTVTLLKDIDLEDNYLEIGKKVTIDLGGYEISGAGLVFNIYSGGELSISGGTISAGNIGAILWGGKLTATDMNISADTCGIWLASDNVIANIESGTVSGGDHGIHVAGGTANIYGGTVSSESRGVEVSYNGIVNISENANISGSYGVYINGDYDPKANITGGTVSGTVNGVYVQSGNATITGGTVSGEADGVFVLGSGIVDITGGRFSHDPSDFVPNTHQVTETEGWYVVSEKPQAEYVAQVGEQDFETLQAAYAAVNETNNTITLLKDIDLGSSKLEVGKKLTLDLNGHNISGSAAYALMVNESGELTVTGEGTVSSSGNFGVSVRGGKLNVEGGTITGGYNSGVIVTEYGTVNISGGTVSGNSTGVLIQNNGTANISGGTVSGNRGVVTQIDGTANIEGGTVSGSTYGVYVYDGIANIEGGTVSGGTYGAFVECIGNRDSRATISGGTVSGGVNGIYVYGGMVTITGGYISGDESGLSFHVGSSSISGGRFNTDPSQYVNSALYQVTTEDGWYVVSKVTRYNITVGTTVNGTVEVDKTSAQAGETVTVTVTPMPGYELTNLSYKKNGMSIGIMGNSFAMPTGDVEIVATFKALPTYRIVMPSTFKGGTVTVDDKEAYAGQEVTVTAAANEGYELAFVSVMTAKGTQITLTDGKFTMPAEVVMITAAFKEKVSYVAQVGEQKFESLQAAIDAAEDGETVVLLSDITLTNDNIVNVEEKYTIMLKVAGKSITLDMNGQNITVDYEGDAQLHGVIFVADGAELIVTGEGTIDVSENGIHIAYMFWKRGETGKLTIENGTYHMDDATDSMVYTNGNEIVEVKGGTFTLDAAGTRVNGFPCIFNAAGSNLRSIKVSGGTYNTNIAEQYWTKEVSLVDAEGNLMAVTKNADGTYTVGSAEAYIEKMVGNNNLTKIGYATLAAAIASVEKNAPETTIVLLKDVKVSGQYIGYSYAQKIVLDLNGKTLSSADRTLNVYRGGTEVLIKNGTVTGNTTAGTIQVSGGAKLTLENATIKSGSKAKAIKINKDGTLVINDASVKVQGGLGDLIVETGAQTLISAGTFNYDVSDYCVEEYGAVKNTDGTYTVKCVILVENVTTGGRYETVAAAIAAIGKNAGVQELKLLGDVTVKGQFIGHSYAQQVVIDLNGFKMSSTDKALTVYRAGTEVTIKNGTVHGNSTGGTIQVTYGGKLTLGENVTITSGGSANALKVDSPATLIIDNDTVKVQGGKNDLIVADGTKVEISAGYFKHPVAEAWCADGKMPNPVKTADGWYTVMDASAAVINGKAYETLHDAFAAVKNGETIKVMKNIDLANEETVTLAEQYKTYFKVEGKSVTIDLNGKTISGTAGNADNMLVGVFSTENDGHLTITGEGTVDVQDGGKVYALIVNYEDGCSIVIENGTYKLDAASDSLIYSGAGYAEGTEGILVQDGTFHLGNLGKGPNGNGSPWIFNVYHKNQNHIMVNGGTFNADVNHQFWANEVFVPETLALKDNDNGTWTVVEAAGYVVEIGVSQHSRARKVGYVDLAAFEGEDVLGNKDGEYFVTGAGSLKQFAEEVGGAVKLENSNIAMTEDITVAENKELLMESDSKIAFNGGGNTITANGTGTKAGESYDYGYVGFIPANKEAATVENVTVTGSGFVEVGHHGTSMGGEYTINNLTVKDLIATLAVNNGGNNIAAAFSHYGNAVMTDCVMTGTTTLKEGFKAYDAAFVNTTKTVMSGCTFGKIYIANQAHVTITNTVIDVIDSYAISTRNLGKLVIGAGAEIGVINLYDTGSYKATLVIEEGANVGAIVYNGVTYTAAEWMAR